MSCGGVQHNMHENTTKRKKSASVNKENETLGLVSKEEENDNLREMKA